VVATKPWTPGTHFADLPTDQLAPGSTARFTFFWLVAKQWEGEDFAVTAAAER
jgi:glucoamylase